MLLARFRERIGSGSEKVVKALKLELAPERSVTGHDEPPKLDVLYFTDPDCSWCWATEPVVKKMLEEYPGQVRVVYKMGGLLESWDTFFDARNQIGRPEQVAPHWVEVAQRSGMPIDERIWYEDPPGSTYPGCIAFKAALLQDERLAEAFLRRLREAVMTERRNISKESVLFELAEPLGLEMSRFQFDYRAGDARETFFQDLSEGRTRGITGFPTMVVVNKDHEEIVLGGYRPYADYEQAFVRLTQGNLHKMPLLSLRDFVHKHRRVTTQEIATVYDLVRDEALVKLMALVAEGEITKELIANGEFWSPVD